MVSPEFTPPILDYSFVSSEADESGLAVSATVFLHDSAGKLFSLHVEGLRAEKANDTDADDKEEPVFTVPGPYVTEQTVSELLNDVQPHLLQQYLVTQD